MTQGEGLSVRIQCYEFHLPFDWRQMKPVDWSQPVDQLFAVELFAGTAGLSAEMQRQHFQVLPIDHSRSRGPKVKLVLLDVTKPQQFQILLQLLMTANIAYFHAAPPCGTASKAREKPMPKWLKHVRAPPLRSHHHLLGLPGLTEVQQQRVQTANFLYAATLLCMSVAVGRNILVSCENPSGSYMWSIMEQFQQQAPVFIRQAWQQLEFNKFQACAHGGRRDKWTTFLSSPNFLRPLRKSCDGSHTHLSWQPSVDKGRLLFPTSEEAAYPDLLCRRVAMLVVTECQKRGATIFPDTLSSAGFAGEKRAARAWGIVSMPPLVSEFAMIADVELDSAAQAGWVKSLEKKGVKRKTESSGGRSADQTQGDQDMRIRDASLRNSGDAKVSRVWSQVQNEPKLHTVFCSGDPERRACEFGYWRSPGEFLCAAQGARHPVDVIRLVPDQLTNSVLQVLRMGPKLTNLKRRLSLAKIKRLRIQLAAEEVKLHAKLDPDVECILQGKNLLLWKKLLEESGYKDLSIWDEVVRGVKMTGPASLSEEMPHGYQVPNMSEREVQAKAHWWRRASVAKCQERDPELDAELWKQTLLEVEKGWLQGPFSEEEVTALVGTSSWLATRRFPLRQKTKVRIIDDGLESGLNASYSTPNKLRLHDLDTLTALALLIRRCLAGKGRQTVAMADGSLRTAELAADWPAEVDLLGRCLDLTDAYKQLAVDPKEAWSRVLVAYDPERKEPRFFLTRALMFGSSASVYSFNRVSRSLWHLGQFFLWQWSTNYYDDYPSIETRETAGSARETMEGLLEELGWRFAKEGKKAKPYCDSFEVLGVVCSLRGTSVSLANKPSRVEAIVANSEAWVRSGWISPGEAASMHGVLNFAKGHFQGRALEPAAKFLSQIAAGGCKEADRELLPEVVSYLHAVVRGSCPREFGIHDDCRPILVFTDGAFEPDAEQKYGAGAVLWDTASQRGSSHSVVVPPDLVAAWQSAGKRQLISELEMLPVLSVCESAADMLWRRRVILFCDNNGVRQMLAKGNTPWPGLFAMLALVHRALAKAECLPWFCRVPSKSNPADGPSRNYWQDEVCAAQCLRGPDFTIPTALVSALLSRQTFLSFLNAESTL